MSIDQFIQDGQEPKVIDKLYSKVSTMLESNEQISYIAIQKKPAVTLLPDSIMISNKRIFLGEFTKLGLSMNFEIFSWREIKDIAFKEEMFGSKVTVIPFTGENLSIDYIPKTQARKLFQFIKVALEQIKSEDSQDFIPQENKTIIQKLANTSPIEHANHSQADIPSSVPSTPIKEVAKPAIQQHIVAPAIQKPVEVQVNPSVSRPILNDTIEDDELTLRLRKLKSLYDKQLITQAEYEGKKAEILAQI